MGNTLNGAQATRRRVTLSGMLAVITVTGLALVSACSSGGTPTATTGSSASPYHASLTYWFWGESDIPGIDKWMSGMVSQYQKLHPGVKINVVPQSTNTLIGAFNTAAQSKAGPDLATQWATLPTLTPLWNGDSMPISNYVPSSETANWLSTNENITGGKIVAMPLYLIGVPLVWNKAMFRQAGLNPNRAPTTWTQFLADCAALKAHGITPFGMGNQDGFFGAWMFAIYLKQELNSLGTLKSAVAGDSGVQPALDADLKNLYTMLEGLIKNGYVNSSVSSLNLNQGWQLFPEKKVAMSFTTDGNAIAWGTTLGDANIGVAAPPIWGSGTLAKTYDVTQSSDEFITSWSQNPRAAATFLAWLHQPANMNALYSETGAFPADKRFNVSRITNPLAKQLYALDTSGPSIWLENYIPPEIDSEADIPAGQLIISGSGTPSAAVALWDQQLTKWRTQQPGELANFKKWAASG
jgi:raffinose/stachyose/melibiose transport system substrate-binding protein